MLGLGIVKNLRFWYDFYFLRQNSIEFDIDLNVQY